MRFVAGGGGAGWRGRENSLAILSCIVFELIANYVWVSWDIEGESAAAFFN